MCARPPPATCLLQSRGRGGARLQRRAAVAAPAHLAHGLQRSRGRHRAAAQLRVAHRRHVIVVHTLRARRCDRTVCAMTGARFVSASYRLCFVSVRRSAAGGSRCMMQARCKPGPSASLLARWMRAGTRAAAERTRASARFRRGPTRRRYISLYTGRTRRARVASLCSRPRRAVPPGPRLQVQAAQQRPCGCPKHERGHDDDDQRGGLDRRQALLRRLPGPRRPAQLQHQAKRNRAAQARAPQHQLRRRRARSAALA